jgi:ATP-dependent Clp protease ATP-binding subunit ClpC
VEETSNQSRRRVGFGSGEAAQPDLEQSFGAAARSALSPELYNRIDEVLVFTPLGKSEVREIARRLLNGVGRTLFEQRGVRLEVDDAVIDALLDAGGFDPTLGARPMKRTLARLVEAPLAEKILRGELASGDVALLGVVDGELSVDVLDGADRVANPAAE